MNTDSSKAQWKTHPLKIAKMGKKSSINSVVQTQNRFETLAVETAIAGPSLVTGATSIYPNTRSKNMSPTVARESKIDTSLVIALTLQVAPTIK